MIIEHMEFDFIISRLFNQKKLRFLDIGAHTGEFLDIFANANHRHKYQVVAIEPLPSNLLKLRLKAIIFSVRGRGRITIVPYGIGKTGTTKFILGDASTLFTSNPEWIKRFSGNFQDSIEIEIQTRDFTNLQVSYPILLNGPFDVVKIDTEGSDLQVLKNIASSEVKFNALIIEFDSTSVAEMISFLKNLGFDEIYAFVRSGIHTEYIGNVLNDSYLKQVMTHATEKAGNIVAFKSPG